MENIGKSWKSFTLALLMVIAISSSSLAFQSVNPFNDLPFHTASFLDGDLNDHDLLAGFDQTSNGYSNHSHCQEVWCETMPNPYGNYYDDLGYEDSNNGGFWLEPPPDDILYIPPPPMPAALHAFFASMGNDTMREFIIGEDPIEGVRCNFCKLFADPKVYQDSDDGTGSGIYPSSTGTSAKENETFISLFYVLIFSLVFVLFCIVCLLIKYKKFRIFSNHSCPVWSSPSVMVGHHHHKSSSSTSTSPSDTCLSPVVNEKSPQSIIMDHAPLASLGKRSTISTTGKYWRTKIPNNVSGNILFMEDRGRGLRSLGGSSTGISDHPYSDAASCTSSPVYAELDPAIAGGHATSVVGGHSGPFGAPYSFSNTYSEVLEGMAARHGHHANAMSSNLLSDSSTYDNAAYLSASSQPFLPGNGGHYNSRSLRRLAAQRAAAAVAAAANNNQISTPLLSNQQYPPFHHQHNPGMNHFFATGGRQLNHKKHSNRNNGAPLSVNYYKYGNTISSRPAMMNHYVTTNETSMMTNETDLSLMSNTCDNSSNNGCDGVNSMFSSSFIANDNSNGSSGSGGPRKSSGTSSSQCYTDMPLIPPSASFSGSAGMERYRHETGHSQNDLNSASSSNSGVGAMDRSNNGGSSGSSSGSGITTATASSGTSMKRPLPPVPGVRL